MTREFKRLQMPQASPFSQVDDKFTLAMSAPVIVLQRAPPNSDAGGPSGRNRPVALKRPSAPPPEGPFTEVPRDEICSTSKIVSP